jgi:hypothetical protein
MDMDNPHTLRYKPSELEIPSDLTSLDVLIDEINLDDRLRFSEYLTDPDVYHGDDNYKDF